MVRARIYFCSHRELETEDIKYTLNIHSMSNQMV